jgi:hypothetical protein
LPSSSRSLLNQLTLALIHYSENGGNKRKAFKFLPNSGFVTIGCSLNVDTRQIVISFEDGGEIIAFENVPYETRIILRDYYSYCNN